MFTQDRQGEDVKGDGSGPDGSSAGRYPPPVDIVLDRPAHVQSARLWVDVAPLQPGQLTSPQAGRAGDGDRRGQDRLAADFCLGNQPVYGLRCR